MEEKGIIIQKSDGETVSFDISKLIEAITAAMEKTFEAIAEMQEMAMEAIVTLLHEFAHCICHFAHGKRYRRKRSLFSIIIFIWTFRHREKPCLFQTYDGISHMLRRVYLRHHLKLASKADDSQIHKICVTC